jgi:hypothetical protein
MSEKYKIGAVIESQDNWTLKGLTIDFERAATLKGAPGKIAPSKKFVIEEVHGGSPSPSSAFLGSGPTAIVSQLRGDHYDPKAPKLTVRIEQEWSDYSLSAQKVPVVGHMKMKFVDFTPE